MPVVWLKASHYAGPKVYLQALGPGPDMAVERRIFKLSKIQQKISRWCHQMKTFSALLAHCTGNSAVTSVFPAQRPVTQSFDVFFDLRLNKSLNCDAGDLRCHHAHYDVTISKSYQWYPIVIKASEIISDLNICSTACWSYQKKKKKNQSSVLLVLCEGIPPVTGGIPLTKGQ